METIKIKITDRNIYPKWYTLIFFIDNTYNAYQGAHHRLEDAIAAAKNSIVKSNTENLFWQFTSSIEEIKNSFNRL